MLFQMQPMLHINLNSFNQKKSQLLDPIPEYKIDILTLNETKLSPTSRAILPGFDLIRRDNTTQVRGPGHCFSIPSQCPTSCSSSPFPTTPTKPFWLQSPCLTNHHSTSPHFTPPHLTTPTRHPPILTHLTTTYLKLVIAADFNSSSVTEKRFKQADSYYGSSVLPTFATSPSTSLGFRCTPRSTSPTRINFSRPQTLPTDSSTSTQASTLAHI